MTKTGSAVRAFRLSCRIERAYNRLAQVGQATEPVKRLICRDPPTHTQDKSRRKFMWLKRETKFAVGFAVIAAFAMSGNQSFAQGADPNAAPNPYKLDEGWLKMPEGRKIGATFGLSIDRDGKSLWAFDRCASADFCAGTNLNPIFKFDAGGKVLANFGAGMFASPHGLYADRDGNVWATD